MVGAGRSCRQVNISSLRQSCLMRASELTRLRSVTMGRNSTAMVIEEARGNESKTVVPEISTSVTGWREECHRLRQGPFRITDVTEVEQINFILAFAAVHRLSLSAGKGSFLVEPR